MSSDPPDGISLILERIMTSPGLTPGERAVADFYERSLPGAAFMNLQQVSQASGVSTATVARFARRLGFADFRALADVVRAEARAGLERPAHRLRSNQRGAGPAEGDVPAQRFDLALHDLSATQEGLSRSEFDRAVALIVDLSRPLYLAAVASGQPLLAHSAMLLGYARGDVTVLDGVDRWAQALAGLDGTAVVLAAAYDRDPLPLLRLLALAQREGAATIVVTNRRSSALFEFADVRLPVVTSRQGAVFGSRVATLALFEALVEAVLAATPSALTRASRIEERFDEFGIHPGRS